MVTSLLRRREGIIISTVEALNDVGLHNISTKIIAKREGVSEGTLFRHFKSKADILLAVLEHYSQYDDDIIQAIRNKKLTPIESILYFIRLYAEYYENYPAITVITQNYDGLLCDPDLSEKMKRIITQRSNFIVQNLENAKKLGMIKSDINCENIADLIMGGFRAICLRWRMNKQNFPLKDNIISTFETIFNDFSIKQQKN